MASEAGWSFEDEFGDMTDDGMLWLTGSALSSDGANPHSLRAVRLKTGQELWRVPIPEAVYEVRYLGRNKLAVQCTDHSTTLFDAISGRKLFTLERGAEFYRVLRWMEICDFGHDSFLVCRGVWSLETGKLLLVEGAPAANFFSDGRRVLKQGDNRPQKSLYPEVVDVETGRTLFRFESAPPPDFPINACRAGDQVLTSTQTYSTQVWERRHPEGWKGHLRRPEVLLSVFLGAAILVLWTSRPRRTDR